MEALLRFYASDVMLTKFKATGRALRLRLGTVTRQISAQLKAMSNDPGIQSPILSDFEGSDMSGLVKYYEKLENDAAAMRIEILKRQLTVSSLALNLVKVLLYTGRID